MTTAGVRAVPDAPRLTPLLVVVAAAWLGLAGAAVVLTGSPWSMVMPQGGASAVVWWIGMTLAMMGPALLPAARHVAVNTLRPASTVPRFVGAYLAVWVVVGCLLTTTAAGAGTLVVGVGGPGWLLPAAVLVVAAAWQVCPVRGRCLQACRGMAVPAATGAPARRAALARGARHGLACAGSCAPLMLVMVVAPGPGLLWTALLAAVVWGEKTRGRAPRLAVPVAAALAVAAAAVVVLGLVGAGGSPGHDMSM